MEKVILNADIREELGKEAVAKLRKAQIVPAVVYKKGKEVVHIKVVDLELFRSMHTSAGENAIITLRINSDKKDKEKTVIIKEVQYHPLKGTVLHVDFNEISLTEKITVNVPIEAKGVPKGVKSDGGILDQPLKEISIQCLPTEIPDKIEVAVEHLEIGDTMRVKDLTIPTGIKVVSDPELTVVSVVPPYVEKPAEEAAEEAITEPEMIREKKPEAEEEGVAEKEPKKEPKKEQKQQDKKE